MSEFSLTAYVVSTGEIKSTTFHSCEESHKPLVITNTRIFWGPEYGVIEAASSPDLQYVARLGEEDVVLDRPQIPYTVDKTTIFSGGEDFCTISGLHDPCEIVIDDPDPLVETTTATVTGGGFEFDAANPGTYTIQISHFPFLPLTLEITAIEIHAGSTTEFASDFSYEFG